MTFFEEEDFGVLLLDPIAPLQDDEGLFAEDEEVLPLLDPSLELRMTVFEEEEDTFLLLLDPFDFADAPLRVTVLAEEDESSSFADVPLSSPQAARAMVNKRTMMDPITPRVPG